MLMPQLMMTRMTTSSNSEPYAEVTERGDYMSLRLFCVPTPASRPRVTRWGTYYGKTYKAYMQAADTAIPTASHTLEGNLRATVEFVCLKPKTTKRLNPRGDIDNHLKAILDAITKKNYWHDDDQVVEITALKRWQHKGEQPHTRITIESL